MPKKTQEPGDRQMLLEEKEKELQADCCRSLSSIEKKLQQMKAIREQLGGFDVDIETLEWMRLTAKQLDEELFDMYS